MGKVCSSSSTLARERVLHGCEVQVVGGVGGEGVTLYYMCIS